MFVEKLNRNSYLKMTDEEILKAVDEAVLNYNVDGYTQHCELVTCGNTAEWIEHDVFDYIAEQLKNKCTTKK